MVQTIYVFSFWQCIKYNNKCEIIACGLSDHSPITLEINLDVEGRGLGIWKLNVKLLKNEQYCEKIDKIIEGMKRAYQNLSPFELWEIIKFQIAQFSREFSSNINKAEQERKFNLYKLLEEIQELMVQGMEIP